MPLLVQSLPPDGVDMRDLVFGSIEMLMDVLELSSYHFATTTNTQKIPPELIPLGTSDFALLWYSYNSWYNDTDFHLALGVVLG